MKKILKVFLIAALAAPLGAEIVVEDEGGEAIQATPLSTPTKAQEKKPVAKKKTRARSPLAGLKQLNVLLRLDEGAIKSGMKFSVAEKDIRSRLKILDLPLVFLERDPVLEEDGFPLLVIEAQTGKVTKWFKPERFLVLATYKDLVRLKRDRRVTASAGLWTVMEHGYDNRPVPAMRESLMRVTDAFLLEAARANPETLSEERVLAMPKPRASEKHPMAE